MATLLRASRPTLALRPKTQRATFSSSAPAAVSLQWDKNDPTALADTVPPYPYGPTRWYKQSRHGLYGGQRMQVGNNVGETFEVKTRRTWHPNVFTRRLFSKSLNRRVQVRVTARTLRTIDKLGGLDEYLLGEKEQRIKDLGESGWWLRWAIMQTNVVKKRFAAQRSALGIPEQVVEEESTVEEMSEAEVQAAVENGETLPMDEAFTVETDAELPPLKFRVGRGQHLMLTSRGWIRTRPSRERAEEVWRKDKAQELGAELSADVAAYKEGLRDVESAVFAELAGERAEKKRHVKDLVKRYREPLKEVNKERMEAAWAEHVATKETDAARRAARKAGKKAEAKKAEGVVEV